MALPDHFRCYPCGAIGEKIYDHQTRIGVYCEACDAFTAYGPVGLDLLREQHEYQIRQHLTAMGHHDLIRHIDEHGIRWEEPRAAQS